MALTACFGCAVFFFPPQKKKTLCLINHLLFKVSSSLPASAIHAAANASVHVDLVFRQRAFVSSTQSASLATNEQRCPSSSGLSLRWASACGMDVDAFILLLFILLLPSYLWKFLLSQSILITFFLPPSSALCIPLWVGEAFFLKGVSGSSAKCSLLTINASLHDTLTFPSSISAEAESLVDDTQPILEDVYYSSVAAFFSETDSVRDDLAEFSYYVARFADILPYAADLVSLVVKYAPTSLNLSLMMTKSLVSCPFRFGRLLSRSSSLASSQFLFSSFLPSALHCIRTKN